MRYVIYTDESGYKKGSLADTFDEIIEQTEWWQSRPGKLHIVNEDDDIDVSESILVDINEIKLLENKIKEIKNKW